MIYLGLDDTDVVGTLGTNQLARAIIRRLGRQAADALLCRHQLFLDPRIPFTSKNGSASIQLPACSETDVPRIVGVARGVMRAWFMPGSDPGLSVAAAVPPDVVAFAVSCQRALVTRRMAHLVARTAGVHLEGLGGSEQGVVGALAAVGLAATGNDGRVVHMAWWPHPDGFSGPHAVQEIRTRGVDEIRAVGTNENITVGTVDVGKHLRPNVRGGRIVLFVEPCDAADAPPWRAVKLP